MNDYQHFDLTYDDDIGILRLKSSRINDHHAIRELGIELELLAKSGHEVKVLFDMSGVEFLSSALLNRLIVMDRQVKAKKGKLAFCNMRQELVELFSITRLNQIFPVYDSAEIAIASLKSKA
jgi:anti-sigma B factor antagonist